MPRGIPRDKSLGREISHRFKITRGHLDKVIKMSDGGEYCIDIVHQSIAVREALKKIEQLILKNHMETCVADAIKRGESKEVIDEMMKVWEKK